MGGVKIDTKGETSIPNLYAVGEAGCTSLHGANRLASNSLLECVVLAYNLGQYLKEKDLTVEETEISTPEREVKAYPNVEELKLKLKDTMWENAGILRTEQSLNKALGDIKELEKGFDIYAKYKGFSEYEFRNMLIVAKTIVKSALARKESRGGHYRVDYPKTLSDAQHSTLTIGDLK
jgi:L-aspartate oxidase